MNSLRRRLLGAVCLFVAAAIWGGMYVVSKYVLDYIPPMTLLAVRLVIGGAALLLVMTASRTPRVGGRDLPRMALLGLVGFGISLAAQFIGTRLSSASHGAVITSVTPAFILVFAATLGGKIYVVGGEAPEGTFAQVEIFDPAANRWTRGPDLPTPRHGLGVVEHQGRLYILAGGPTPGGSASAAVEILEP